MSVTIANNYPNPLDNFRTYSYHYLMTAASSTEAMADIIGSSNKTPLYSRVQNIGLGEAFTVGQNTAYLVLDTRRFVQYTITDLEFEHLIGTGKVSNPSAMTSLSSMKIQDTTGLSFFNYIADLTQNKLKSTHASAFFLLSILFIGHKDDGTTETISTCHIPFTILKMGFNFGATGSIYDISFATIEGLTKNTIADAQVNGRCDVNNVSTVGRSKTIGGLIQSLEDQLNTASTNFYVKYNKGSTSKRPGKLVQYMITLPDEWKNFQPDLAQSNKNSEQRFPSRGKVKAASNKIIADSQITFSASSSITDSIKLILESSTDFLKLLSKDNKNNDSAAYFKCIKNITSDDSTYILHFDIFPVKILTPEKIKSDKINLIEYDFIYTGFNSHIQDLNIEFQPEAAAVAINGAMRLGRTALAQNAEAGQKMSDVKLNEKQSNQKINERESTIRDSDPIFFGAKTVLQHSNAVNHYNENTDVASGIESFKAKQEYLKTLANLHFLGSINLDMKLRGNPNIIRKFADVESRGGVPPHTPIINGRDIPKLLANGQLEDSVKTGFATAKREYITTFIKPKLDSASKKNVGDPLSGGPDLSVQGVFVKLNIKAPNVDYAGNFIEGEPLYTEKMFYDGLYMVLKVKTTFSGGEFSHLFTMIAQPKVKTE